MVHSVIIGMGEVGKALIRILKRRYDTVGLEEGSTKPDQCKILNICIPYSKNFVKIVNDYIDHLEPDLTINHSTVPVGTTAKLKGRVVHSPIRGTHPNMEEGIRRFVKYVGYNDLKDYATCLDYLSDLRIKGVKKPETTELAKLLSLARYGIDIAFTKVQDKMCKKWDLKYNEVVREWDLSYNEGLEMVERGHLKRPIMYVLRGPIKGHCVSQNVRELNKQFKDSFLEAIIENDL